MYITCLLTELENDRTQPSNEYPNIQLQMLQGQLAAPQVAVGIISIYAASEYTERSQ